MAKSRRSSIEVGALNCARRVFGCVILPALAALSPLDARAQSLESALATVYENNPVLQAGRAHLRAIDEKLPQALSNWRPTVSLSLAQGASSYGPASGAPRTPQPGNNAWLGTAPQDYGLTVSQPVYRGGRTEAEKAQALNLIRAERARLLNTEQTVFLAAAKDYLDVVVAKATLDLNIAHQQLAQRELQATRGRFNAGELTQTDVAQTEAAFANAIAGRQRAEGALETAQAAFFHDIGFHPGNLHSPDAAPLLPLTRESAIELAGRSNPAVIAGGFDVSAQQDDIKLIRGELLPTITLNARLDQQRTPTDNNAQTDTKEIYAEMSVPLYEGGKVYSQSREAQQTLTQLRDTYEEAHQLAILSASQAWDTMQAQRATAQALTHEISADQLSLDGVRSEQGVGARTELDVLNAQEALFQAQLAEVQAQHDEMVAEFSLEAAVGQMTAAGLGVRVSPYDADLNLETVRNKWFGFGTADVRPIATPTPAHVPAGGYYDVGEPGLGVTVPLLDTANTRDYVSAAAPPAHSTGIPAAVNPAALAVLNDYDHDLQPRSAPNKWMDPSDP
jgi:outer membrane protein